MSKRGAVADNVVCLVRRHKKNYLRDRQTDAGFFAEWWPLLHSDALVEVDARMAFDALLHKTAQKIWREDTDDDDAENESDDQTSLFHIAGVPIKQELRFPDESVPGKHRTVLSEFATIAQLFGQAEVVTGKGEQTTARGKQMLHAANEALRRSGGIASELLRNVAD
jgi:hypothetical protein